MSERINACNARGMDAILLHTTDDGLRTFALAFRSGDRWPGSLPDWLQSQHVESASFSAIGACQSITLGYFDFDIRDYRRIPVDQQVEVLSLSGNVAIGPDDAPRLHAHVAVGLADGTARGGHLLEARVRPTLEVVLVEHPPHLRRQSDPETGLALLATGRTPATATTHARS